MVNLVGDHAVAHKPLGAPLASDIESVVRPASHWLRTVRDARSAATDTAEAVAAARAGGVATLIVPADAGWEPSLGPVAPRPVRRAGRRCRRRRSRRARGRCGGGGAALLLGRRDDRAGAGWTCAARIAAATGARCSATRSRRGSRAAARGRGRWACRI